MPAPRGHGITRASDATKLYPAVALTDINRMLMHVKRTSARGRNLPFMTEGSRVIEIRPTVAAGAGAGCGHCGHASAAACEASPAGRPCADPELRGDPQALAHVLGALRTVLDEASSLSIVDARRVSALRLVEGEAELELTVSPRCGSGRRVFEDAFQVLRSALPDTDVYVRQAA